MSTFPVLHVLDQAINLNSRYYRAIGERHDRGRYPVTFVFVDNGFDPMEAQERLAAPVESLRVNSRLLYPLAILRLAQRARRSRAAFIHGHFFYPTLVGLAASRLAGCRFVFTRHHSDHHIRIEKQWHTRIDAFCANHSSQVIAVSQETQRLMIEIEHVNPQKITTVYNGMEPLQPPAPGAVERLRLELGIQDEPVCLMIGRLHEEKGHRYLFAALPCVVAAVGRLTMLIAGDGGERQLLEAEVAKQGMADFVRFVGWRREIPELISLSSLVVLPSLAESFGFAVLEAMSLGRPIVAAATGGLREVVEDGKSGILVPAKNPDALARAMIRVLVDQALAAKLGTAGIARAASFSFDRMMSGYEAVYGACLDGAKKPR